MFDQDREQIRQVKVWLSTNDSQDEQMAALCSEFAKAGPDILRLRLPPQEYIALLEAALAAARRLGDRRAELQHLLEICRLE